MAISHALLLLASLFFVPVFSQVTVPYEYCDNQASYEVDVRSVLVSPVIDDNVQVSLACTKATNIEGQTFVYVKVTSTGQPIFISDLCDVTTCIDSQIATDLFVLNLSNVLLVGDKDTKYSISMETENFGEPTIIRTCVTAKLNTTSISP